MFLVVEPFFSVLDPELYVTGVVRLSHENCTVKGQGGGSTRVLR